MSILRLRPIFRLCGQRHVRAFSCNRLAAKDLNNAAPVSEPLSSCPPNTVLEGLSYLKDQPPVLARSDEEYPPWLWDLLEPRELPDDGPGGKAEKMRLRKENKQKIKDQNFMKTQ